MDLDGAVVDFDWFSGATKGTNEVFAMACVDGSFKLVSKLGRVEKSIPDAHVGAVS
jgi:intraflagellar transport protein 80